MMLRLIEALWQQNASTPSGLVGSNPWIIQMHRVTRAQTERAVRVLLHLFQHQVHHRRQAHAMEAPPRATEFRELGRTEASIWSQ
jgi:hypothetical protein